MADIRLYLEEVEKGNKNDATQVAQRTAQRLQTRELKLLGLIETMGEYLNNENATTRERTMLFLAEVIGAVPNGVLSLQQRSLLLDFVTARISDREVGIGSCANVLRVLQDRGKWDAAQATKVVTSLLDYTHPLADCGSVSQRYPVLLLLDDLMANHRGALLTLHKNDSKFLSRFVSYFDREKDPRNLMIVFSILAVVMTEWDISNCIMELFDAAFNYFPIVFRPPPDDIYKITARDLKERLLGCITATPALAHLVFPALLEKLDSTTLNTKRDVLQALHRTVTSYGTKTIGKYAIILWDAVKFEVLQAQEEELAQESLKILAAIGVTLSYSRDALLRYLDAVVKECNEHLEDAPTKQSDAACRMLYAIARDSSECCNVIVNGTMPRLFILYKSTDNALKRRSLIHTLAKIIEASCEVFGDWRTSPLLQDFASMSGSTLYGPASENSLKQYSTQILELLIATLAGTATKEVSYRLAIVGAMVELAKAREILDNESLSKIIKTVNEIVISEESYGKDEVKIAAANALVTIAHLKPQLVIDSSFPIFLSKLPDSDVGHDQRHILVLEAFAKVGVEEKIFNTTVLRLKNRLNTAIQCNSSVSYIRAILSALLYVFTNTKTPLQGTDTTCPFYTELLVPLITTVPTNLGPDQLDDSVFGLIGRLCNQVLRIQTPEFQKTFACEIYTLMSRKPLEEVAPFKSNASFDESRSLIISLYLLAAIRKDVPLAFDSPKLVSCLVNAMMMDKLSIGTKAAILQQIGLVVNKFISQNDLEPTLRPILDTLLSASPEVGLKLDSTRVVFAILKALILRNSKMATAMFPPILSSLSETGTGLSIAHGLSTLLQPDEILTKENHCIVSTLHKQKTFSTLIPEISKQYREAPQAVKKNYLVALSGILRWIPYEALESDVSSLTPLMLQTLDIDGEDDIKAGTIDQLKRILMGNGKALEQHVSSVITRLLTLSSSYSNPPRVRAKALQCLNLVVANLRLQAILPYRKQVLKRLTSALDDRRREVRVEAVRCRTKWINMGAVEDDG